MSGPAHIDPWPGRFADPELEQAFLRSERGAALRNLRWTASIGGFAYAVSGIPEWLGAPSTAALLWQLLPRLVVVLLAPLVVWGAGRAADPEGMARWTRGYASAVGVAFLLTGFGSVAGLEAVFLALIGYALIATLFLPLDPRWALAVSGVPIFGFLIGLTQTEVSFADWLDIGLVGGISVFLAAFTSARLGAAHRRTFATLAQERETRRVSERREADFVRLFDINPSPLAITTAAEGSVLRVNASLRRLLRVPPEQALGELNALDFYRTSADRKRFVRRLRRDGWVRMDVGLRSTVGTTLEATMEAYPAEYEGQDALVVSVTDRTEERHIARRLRDARDQAEAANRLKTQFLAHMSHEIRTPMNGVLGMAELLTGTRLDEEQLEMLRVLSSSSRALLRIIDDILDLTKVEAGMLALEREPFCVAELVEQVRDSLHFTAESKGVQLRAEVGAGVPAGLVGDEDRLRQVIVNLAGNALKFTSEGSVQIRLGAELEVLEGEGVRVEVSDTGIGVSPAQLERIFTPFVQADASTARRYGGTGLGLAISRRLVEAMGGQMGARSEPGVGSTFWFEIPLPAAEVVAPRRAQSVLRPVARAGLRVLLVEDNLVNQRVAQRMLERLGTEVLVADDGRAAQDILRLQTVDLVLMDVEMPDIDGKAATRWFRTLERSEKRPRTPVVALTAHAFAEDRQACLEAGMDDYLSKPIGQRALHECLMRHVPADVGEPSARAG